MQPARIQLRLADALGQSQALRAVAEALAERSGDPKVTRRAEGTALAAAAWQERLNEIVVADPAAREALTSRARHARDAAVAELHGAEDALAIAELLAGVAAREAAQWEVVRRLAKARDDTEVLGLADEALSACAGHLRRALKSCSRLAKAEASAAA